MDETVEQYDISMWELEVADFEEVSLLQALMHYRELAEQAVDEP